MKPSPRSSRSSASSRATKAQKSQEQINSLTKLLKTTEGLKWSFLRLSPKYRKDYKRRKDRDASDPYQYNLVEWINPQRPELPKGKGEAFTFNLGTIHRKPHDFPIALKSERFFCLDLALPIPPQIRHIRLLALQAIRSKQFERTRIRGFSLDEDFTSPSPAQGRIVKNYLQLLEWQLDSSPPTDDNQLEQLFGPQGSLETLESERAAAIRLRDGDYRYIGFSAYVKRSELIVGVEVEAARAKTEKQTSKKREERARDKGISTDSRARLVRPSARKT